jgi:hypothetical protein
MAVEFCSLGLKLKSFSDWGEGSMVGVVEKKKEIDSK